MRELYIVDDIGSTYFFDKRNDVYLTNIAGLGFERVNTYLKYPNSYKEISTENNISQITASVVFLKGYEGYTSFLNYFRNSVGKLRLFYKSDNLKYTYVSFKGISKSELTYGSLTCGITLDKLTYWLLKQNHLIDVTPNDLNKVYPYKFPCTYANSYNGEKEINNNGCITTQLRIEINGKTLNPTVEIMQGGLVLETLRLIIETKNLTDKIIIDANPETQEMTLISEDKFINIYAYQDFNCKNFLELKKGTYTIKFNPGVSSDTTCKISYLEMYEGN